MIVERTIICGAAWLSASREVRVCGGDFRSNDVSALPREHLSEVRPLDPPSPKPQLQARIRLYYRGVYYWKVWTTECKNDMVRERG